MKNIIIIGKATTLTLGFVGNCIEFIGQGSMPSPIEY
jgi:hypothetical protein